MKKISRVTALLLVGAAFLLTAARPQPAPVLQTGDSTPPSRVVKLIFIHHSTGENWLSDGYGDLGSTLGGNNYYVSDTNYGWGPDGIGDRTDIPDWQEWFSSDNTPAYMEALFQENGQNAEYTRGLSDPGGENEIVMFKSCFPNSDLEGNPNDPPSPDGWMSAGHAKYVYNEILGYFESHPEKLFIVITAPPLSDLTNADNARAFNQWLVNSWLSENQYPYHNVAVFDFYKILTGTDGHHTFENGEEVYQTANKNTLHYPSGDDHPSKKGSKKATEEFIPLLNYFYNRWQREAPAPIPAEVDTADTMEEPAVVSPVLSGMIDNFDGTIPAGTSGWEAFWDASTPSLMNCTLDTNSGLSGGALMVDFNIVGDSWGTCALFHDQPQDWSEATGITFMLLGGGTGSQMDVDLYVDGPDGLETYISQVNLGDDMSDDWTGVVLRWEEFQRVDWEADAGSPFTKPGQVSGMAFGFSGEGVEGTIWVEDLGWIEGGENYEPSAPFEEPSSGEEEGEAAQPVWNIPCLGSLAVPLGMVGILLVRKKETAF